MEQIFGAFYLERTLSGNLIGEYTNNTISIVLTESADIEMSLDASFGGDYNSTWREVNGPVLSRLEIRIDRDSGGNKYLLNWIVNNRTAFVGQGFLKDNMLVGAYRSV